MHSAPVLVSAVWCPGHGGRVSATFCLVPGTEGPRESRALARQWNDEMMRHTGPGTDRSASVSYFLVSPISLSCPSERSPSVSNSKLVARGFTTVLLE